MSVDSRLQRVHELAGSQNSDKCEQKHANWWKVALIRFFSFFSSEVIYIRMFLFVLRETFACF